MSSKNDLPKTRSLKVYFKVFYRDGKHTVHFPEIRLIGKWLADCGFRPGQHIEVRQEENKLTITPALMEDSF